MNRFPTAMPAIVTPFDDHGEVATDAHEHNVRRLSSLGCTGFLVAGSTGEGPYLEPGERAILVGATRRASPTATILCGINAETPRQARTQIDEASESGADAVLVATPGTLVRDRHDGVERFYELVADAAPVPVLLYTVPAVTGYELPTDVIDRLADHPNIVGVKDSGGDPSRIPALERPIRAGFLVYAGSSRVLAESHAAGGYGAITASANYAFGLVADAAVGDRAAQADLVDLIAAVEPHRVPGTKYAASAAGLITGPPRLPLVPVTTEVGTAITVAVDNAQRRHSR